MKLGLQQLKSALKRKGGRKPQTVNLRFKTSDDPLSVLYFNWNVSRGWSEKLLLEKKMFRNTLSVLPNWNWNVSRRWSEKLQLEKKMYCLQWLIPVLLLPKPVKKSNIMQIFTEMKTCSWWKYSGEPSSPLQPRNVCNALPCWVSRLSSINCQ